MENTVETKNRLIEYATIAAFLGLGPLLWMQAMALWEKPHFQFFPLAWIAFSWLVVTTAKVSPTCYMARRVAGISLISLALVLAVIAGLKVSPWAAQVATILFLTGWGFIRLGATPWTRLIAWSLLLWITVPLPLGYDAAFIQRLQQISSESSAHLLDLLGTPHLRLGNLIELKSGKLFVDEACSGVDSLYSLGAIAILIIVLQRTSLLVGLVLLALVPAWAWLGNMTRLTLIAWLLDTYGIDLSHGPEHTALGMLTFSIAAISLFVTNRFLSNLTAAFASSALPRENAFWHNGFNRIAGSSGAVADTSRGPSSSNAKESDEQHVSQALSGMLKGLFVCTATVFLVSGGFCLWTLRQQGVELSSLNLPHFRREAVDIAAGENAFPKELTGAVRVRHGGEERNPDSLFGQYSRFWTYVSPQGECLVSLDFPFRGFHPLWVCYQNAGNTLVASPEIKAAELDGRQWSFVEMEIKDDLDNFSCLWFTLFDDQANPIAMRSLADYKTTGLEDFMGRMGLNAGGASPTIEPVTFQCQLLVQSSDPLSPAARESFRRLFLSALKHGVRVSQAIVVGDRSK